MNLSDSLSSGSVARHDVHRLAFDLEPDVDDFKKVNDAVGHSIGDQVLRDVAKRLEV